MAAVGQLPSMEAAPTTGLVSMESANINQSTSMPIAHKRMEMPPMPTLRAVVPMIGAVTGIEATSICW